MQSRLTLLCRFTGTTGGSNAATCLDWTSDSGPVTSAAQSPPDVQSDPAGDPAPSDRLRSGPAADREASPRRSLAHRRPGKAAGPLVIQDRQSARGPTIGQAGRDPFSHSLVSLSPVSLSPVPVAAPNPAGVTGPGQKPEMNGGAEVDPNFGQTPPEPAPTQAPAVTMGWMSSEAPGISNGVTSPPAETAGSVAPATKPTEGTDDSVERPVYPGSEPTEPIQPSGGPPAADGSPPSWQPQPPSQAPTVPPPGQMVPVDPAVQPPPQLIPGPAVIPVDPLVPFPSQPTLEPTPGPVVPVDPPISPPPEPTPGPAVIPVDPSVVRPTRPTPGPAVNPVDPPVWPPSMPTPGPVAPVPVDPPNPAPGRGRRSHSRFLSTRRCSLFHYPTPGPHQPIHPPVLAPAPAPTPRPGAEILPPVQPPLLPTPGPDQPVHPPVLAPAPAPSPGPGVEVLPPVQLPPLPLPPGPAPDQTLTISPTMIMSAMTLTIAATMWPSSPGQTASNRRGQETSGDDYPCSEAGYRTCDVCLHIPTDRHLLRHEIPAAEGGYDPWLGNALEATDDHDVRSGIHHANGHDFGDTSDVHDAGDISDDDDTRDASVPAGLRSRLSGHPARRDNRNRADRYGAVRW